MVERASKPSAAVITVVALALVAAYWPSLGGGFIWDDDAHIVDNHYLRNLAGLAQIWIPGHTPQYYPVTFSLFWAQYQLWGASPLGYDLVNLALHALNALLVWRVFAQLGVRFAPLLAAAFALHPVHVESVAWAMELKNVLSATFYLAAASCYLRFDAERERGDATPRGYFAACALFACALLSKSVTETLPAALALALVWRGGALGLRRFAPVAPLFVLGVGAGLLTTIVERDFVGARGAEFALSLADRALVASRALLFYAQKLVAPYPLMFCYPRWEISAASASAYWPLAAALAIGAASLAAFVRGRRGIPLALAFFAGSLFPALGFIDFYPMIYSFVADHFVYLPSLGLLAAGLALGDRLVAHPIARSAACLALLGALAALTFSRAGDYRDAQTLYRHSIAHDPSGYLCVALTGTELVRQAQLEREAGRESAARAHFAEAKTFSQRALTLKENQPPTHIDLAVAHFALGEAAPGVRHALRAAELAPASLDAQLLAGNALAATGRPREAILRFERAVALAPAHFEANLRLAQLARSEAHARAALAAAASEEEAQQARAVLAGLRR
ncbi:MAG: hypothetical protein FJ091_21275 [Deltaproteobacteria bacterium]|nr:hypothetical protein [Deltaproteobacteria bacterium]